MKIKEELNKHKKLLAAVSIILLALAATAIAVTIITAPEHVTGNPIDNPEPTPTTSPVTIELHLTSNNTSPFYKGDGLEMTATLTPALANINVTLYNNGGIITTAKTDASGKAVFVRYPTLPFDYTVSAELP